MTPRSNMTFWQSSPPSCEAAECRSPAILCCILETNHHRTNSSESINGHVSKGGVLLRWPRLIVPLPQVETLPGNVRGAAVYHMMTNGFALGAWTVSSGGSAAQLAGSVLRGDGLPEAATKAAPFEKRPRRGNLWVIGGFGGEADRGIGETYGSVIKGPLSLL